MKRILSSVVPMLLLALAVAVLLPAPATAGCTASVNCNNACSLDFTCSPRPCELFCSASSQTVSCTGNSVCSVGATSVTCDSVVKSCPTTSQCHQTSNSVTCGTTTRMCTPNCPL
ncbi:MAG TPA: hypothetical protein VF173_26315 [Thermoanaerobaculia bacterium]|nr:hypothetical protein [Thermoanaerobaculia bacterium]